MPTVLLTDPDQRAALAAARALHRAGYRVITAGSARGLAGASRATSKHVAMPTMGSASADIIRAQYTSIVRAHAVDVVVPVTDAASRLLLGHDEGLGARVAGPTAAAYARASDKETLLHSAATLGLTVPAQVVVPHRSRTGPNDESLRFPLFVKPSRSVVDVDGVAERQGVRFAANAGQLQRVLAAYPDAAFPVLLQERTIGPGVGVFLLRHEGANLLTFGHRRLREKPPSGGVSTYRESLVPPPHLVSQCEALLDALDYSGAAMIEFKQDAATGGYVLMEINARLWGSVQLAMDAGIDFPSMLVAMTLGLPLPRTTSPRAGVRSYWELGEIDHALAIARKSAEALHAPPGFAVGWRAAARALRDHGRDDHREVFRWADPMPFGVELFAWLRNR